MLLACRCIAGTFEILLWALCSETKMFETSFFARGQRAFKLVPKLSKDEEEKGRGRERERKRKKERRKDGRRIKRKAAHNET